MTTDLKTIARRGARDAVLRTGWGAHRDVRRVLRAAAEASAGRAETDGERGGVRDAVREGSGEGVAVLVAPPGGGNVGDQAMVEAFLSSTPGEVVIVTSSPGSIAAPAGVLVVCLPQLLYGERGRPHGERGGPHGERDRRRDALDQFGRLLARARSVSVVGADIMDGFYNPRASVQRAVVAEAAARHGVEARVLGFSWPNAPHPAARRRLGAAVRAGVIALPRDPVSMRRLEASGIRPPALAADIVFVAHDADDALRRSLPLRGPYAIVNASGHIGRGVDLVPDYVRIVAALRERGLEVVVLPHVATTAADDRTPCAEVAARFDDGVHLVARMPTPAEVRGLTSEAQLTITGRMHLAIMSFLFGVPAITLASQGKVEGLMESLGTPGLCIEPVPGIADRVIGLVDDALPADSALREAIAAALPAVRARALLNVPALAEERA